MSLAVFGVSNKIELNVKKRLNELQQFKNLDELSQDELQAQIIEAIRPFGYFNAHVQIQKQSKKQLNIRINPGPQIIISKLHITCIGEGAQNPLLKQAVKDAPIHQGNPLLTEEYEQTKLKLVTAAETQGYLHASFNKNEILIDEQNNTAEITLNLDTGPLYYFGQIQFDPTYINPKLLHRFAPFHPGQIYSAEKVLQLNNDLANSGYFRSVQVKPKITEDPSVPIAIHTEPIDKYSYTLGAGYGTDTGIRGRAALNVIPINSQGHKLNLLAQGSFVQNALQAQYLIPGKNPITDQYSLTTNFSNLKYTAGYSNSFLASLAQQHHVKNYQQTFSLNALREEFHYADEQNKQEFLVYPKVTFSFSKTEGLLFSPSGYNVTINALAANNNLLSTMNFGQISLDAKTAIKIEPLGLRVYGHGIQGFTAVNNINQQPLSLALLLGGTDNLKAFGFNSIGPGRIISYGGLELQKETKKNWYLVAFYDVGAVYNPIPRTTLYDAGGGLMWVSPIGPIKVGLAQSIDSHWQRNSKSPNLVISMGPDL